MIKRIWSLFCWWQTNKFMLWNETMKFMIRESVSISILWNTRNRIGHQKFCSYSYEPGEKLNTAHFFSIATLKLLLFAFLKLGNKFNVDVKNAVILDTLHLKHETRIFKNKVSWNSKFIRQPHENIKFHCDFKRPHYNMHPENLLTGTESLNQLISNAEDQRDRACSIVSCSKFSSKFSLEFLWTLPRHHRSALRKVSQGFSVILLLYTRIHGLSEAKTFLKFWNLITFNQCHSQRRWSVY